MKVELVGAGRQRAELPAAVVVSLVWWRQGAGLLMVVVLLVWWMQGAGLPVAATTAVLLVQWRQGAGLQAPYIGGGNRTSGQMKCESQSS